METTEKTTVKEPPFGRTAVRTPNQNTRYIVNDFNGLPVFNEKTFLAWHSSTGRFYVGLTKPQQYLGRDLQKAIWRFKELTNPTPTPVHLSYNGLAKDHVKPKKQRLLKELEQQFNQGQPLLHYELKDEPQVLERVRDLILHEPKEAVRLLGIEELGHLRKLPRPEQSLTVTKIWRAYQTQPNPPGKDWMKIVRSYWRDFVHIVGVTRLEAINIDNINGYRKAIMSEESAPATVRNIFGSIKAVLRSAEMLGKDVDNVERVLKLCKALVPPANDSEAEPQPIDPKDFKKLLKAADVRQKAIFLLSLNAMLHRSEVAAVLTEHIDLKKKTLSMKRNKTSVRRAAMLWDETVKAIKAYQKIDPHKNPFLFLNSIGTPLNRNSVGKNFRTVAKKAGLPDTVQFGHLRDGGYTAAIEGGLTVDQARIVAGHKLAGVSDAYIQRNPKMVEKACKAIAGHYGIK